MCRSRLFDLQWLLDQDVGSIVDPLRASDNHADNCNYYDNGCGSDYDNNGCGSDYDNNGCGSDHDDHGCGSDYDDNGCGSDYDDNGGSDHLHDDHGHPGADPAASRRRPRPKSQQDWAGSAGPLVESWI